MLETPDMTTQETFDAHAPKDQKRTSAEAKLADHVEKLEEQLRVKEKECIELRKLVDACGQVLPQRTMTDRKAASMINLGGKNGDDLNDESSRVLPRRTMAGRMVASCRRRFSSRSEKRLTCDALEENSCTNRTAETVESDYSA
jgi:hypothetical protein